MVLWIYNIIGFSHFHWIADLNPGKYYLKILIHSHFIIDLVDNRVLEVSNYIILIAQAPLQVFE